MKFAIDFHPKILSSLHGYNRQKFTADLMSGIIVVIVALPLAIAFGIASGVAPGKGLVTAIIGGFIVSLLSGSNVQIGGPSGSFIVIVSGIIGMYGLEGLAVATFMAGIMLVLMGVFKLGVVIKFIPYPVIIGFTAGIAVTIFSTQIRDLFGLEITTPIPDDFISKWGVYFSHFNTMNWWSLGISLLSILLIVITPKVSRKIPGSLVALIVITALSYTLREHCGVDTIKTIGDRFSIDASLPAPERLAVSWSLIKSLIPSAFAIAMLIAIESLLSATIADGVTGDRHNANTELIAQGTANIIVPIFGGIPVTGALARTMTNINNGGRTPVAGILHAIFLLLILLFLAPMTSYIPMACLGGILAVVSYNMSEWRTIRGMMKNPKADILVLFTTFFLTVVFDLTVAITAGLIMAVLLFMKRIMETTNISVVRNEIDMEEDAERSDGVDRIEVAKEVEVYEIDGPFFFGVANKFDAVMRELGDRSAVRIIRMRRVPFIDSTGLHNLENLIRASHKEEIAIILSGVSPTVKEALINAGVDKLVGTDNICANINIAAERANTIISEKSGQNLNA